MAHKDYSRQKNRYAIIDNWHGGYSGYCIVHALQRNSEGDVMTYRTTRVVASTKTVEDAQSVLDTWLAMSKRIERLYSKWEEEK